MKILGYEVTKSRPEPTWQHTEDDTHPLPPFLATGLKPPWLQDEFKGRISRQAKHRELFLGRHSEVWKSEFLLRLTQLDVPNLARRTIELAVNFPGRLSKLWAGLMVGEFPRVYTADKNTTAGMQAILDRSKAQQVMYEGDLTRSYAGEVLYKVLNDGLHSRIQTVSPAIWFPWADPTNVKEPFVHVLAFEVKVPGVLPGADPIKYVRAEIHYRGFIKHRMWRLRDGKIAEPVSIPGMAEDGYDVETGVDDFLIHHVPNLSLTDQLEGIDDYCDAESLFIELDVRLSQIARILDQHSDPNMYGPKSSLQYNPDTQSMEYAFTPGGKFFPVNSKEDIAPGYLTWDGKLDAAFKELEKVLDCLFFVTSTTPTLFSVFGDKSGGATSGTALKLRLVSPLAKVNEKRIYLDPAIRRVLLIAQQLEEVQGRKNNKSTGYTPEYPSFDWADGIPQDEKELSDRLQVGTANQPFISLETAISTLHPTWDDETVQAEVERIREDSAMSGPLPIGGPPVQDVVVDPNADDPAANA